MRSSESQACPTALPASAGLGSSSGLCVLSAAVWFSVKESTLPVWKRSPAGKGKGSCPGGRCRTGLELSAPRGSRCLGERSRQDGLANLPCSQRRGCPCRGVYGMDCTDLAGNVRSALFVWTSPRDSSPSSRSKTPCRTSEGHC